MKILALILLAAFCAWVGFAISHTLMGSENDALIYFFMILGAIAGACIWHWKYPEHAAPKKSRPWTASPDGTF